MHFSSLVPIVLVSGLSLATAQYTEILTSAIAELSQATASLTVHSGAQYESALSLAESGYSAITGLIYASPSLSSQYGSLVNEYASELSGFSAPGAAAPTLTSSALSSASSAAGSAVSSLSSAISSASSVASSIASSASSAAASSSSAGSSMASAASSSASASASASAKASSGASGVVGVSAMGVLGAGLLGLAAWL